MAASGTEKAKQVGDSAALKALARVGLVSYGIVHLLIGWLALELAWGAGPSKKPDPSGAFRTVAEQPMGNALLWLVAVGLAALGVWKASEVLWGHRHVEGVERLRKRVSSGVFAAIYTGLGLRSALVAVGSGAVSSQTQDKATIGVLAWPGGRAIVVAIGLIVIGVGLAVLIRGVRKSFSELIDTSSLSSVAQNAVLRLGQIGYIGKGLAYGMVGGVLSYAAYTFDAKKASGLDGALHTILAQPFGNWMLSAMAFGFVSFGFFAILQFRYRRM
jgi:hypothetical protein